MERKRQSPVIEEHQRLIVGYPFDMVVSKIDSSLMSIDYYANYPDGSCRLEGHRLVMHTKHLLEAIEELNEVETVI